jgi:ubiquitin carboxyl-terminal hydrolase 34
MYGFYISKAVFWDDFGVVANKVLTRRYNWMNTMNDAMCTEQGRYPFGDHFSDDLETYHIFDRFLGAYARICSFLFAVDAHLLAQQPPDEPSSRPLLSQKHIRFLHNILRFEKTPLFHILAKEYGVDVRELNTHLQKLFLEARGAQNLLRLMGELFHRVPPAVQNNYATFASQIFSVLGWTIWELPSPNTCVNRTVYHRGILSFFQKYSIDICDPSISTDAGVARDLIQFYTNLVFELCQWDDSIAAELVDGLSDFGDPDSPTISSAVKSTSTSDIDYRQDPRCYPALVANAWKFKVLRKYIIRGNMGLRVMSIATMDAALVELWRELSNIDPSCKHPVIQYLADFLLQGQVIDYIVSVDSHPQLISRSGNIAGFLVIAHRWSDDQADAIWRTVSSSPDPRVVAATMTMLRGIINLMTITDRLYLCMKLYDLPIDRYTLDILRFFRHLTGSLAETSNNNIQLIDFDGRGPTARPWNVCLRVIRDTAPSRASNKNMLDMHFEAIDQLRCLTVAISPDERHSIYRECAQQIAEDSEKATGNYRIMCLLAQYSYADDSLFFQENGDLMLSMLKEIPTFVEREAQAGPYTYQSQALHYRLDFLRVTISHPAMTVPSDLFETLWDHIVGGKALSNEARDLAWSLLLNGIKASPDDEFCKQLVSSYLPAIDAQLYTPGLFEFVASYNFPITRQTVQTEQGNDTLLQIPGASLLWPIILSSPAGTIEDRAARLLATRYVKVVETDGIMVPEVEKAHIALVEQCMQGLRAAIKTLPKHAATESNPEDSNSEDGLKVQHTSEVQVERILLFQKLLLECVRQKPEFNRGRRVDSKVDAMDTEVPFGDGITVRYQCGNDRQYVTMASDHTLDDLYRRLCHATGFTKINLFARGQRLKVFEKGALKISEVDFGGQVIVQRADGAELTRPLPQLAAGSSVFETAIVKHFDELFAWMDSADTTSFLVSIRPVTHPCMLTVTALRLPDVLPSSQYFCRQCSSARSLVRRSVPTWQGVSGKICSAGTSN